MTTETTGQLPENDTAVPLLDLRATDPDGDDSRINYAITAGDTNRVFRLTRKQKQDTVGGAIHYVSLDYAGPAQNYEALFTPSAFATLTVRATDESSLTVDRTVTISVTDVNERPTVIGPSTISFAEDSTDDVASYYVSDPDAGQEYDWFMLGVDGGYVDIYASVDTRSVRTLFFVQPNYERKTSYALQVKVIDNGTPPLSHSLDVTVTITDANDAPKFTEGNSAVRSLPENSAADVDVGAAVGATDEDGDTLAYSLAGTDAASFSIDPATGQLSTKAGVTYDFETKRSYSLTVTATDTGDPALAGTIPVTVSLTDVNEKPVVSGNTAIDYAENGADAVATYTVTDLDAASDNTISLEGTDKASFSISAEGVLTFKAPPDFENPADSGTDNVYAVTVTATDSNDSTLSHSLPLTVTVTDVNEPPVFSAETYAFSVSENTAPWTTFGTVMATDPDAGDSALHAITAGNTGGKLSIDGFAGLILVRYALDHETTPTYTLTVKATEFDKPAALSDTATVTITVTDVNEKPVFTDGEGATREVPENSKADVDVGAPIAATDPEEGTLTYFLSGADAASFAIDPETGQLSTKSGVIYDYETKSSYSVTVTATDDADPALSADIPVTIALSDVPTYYRQKRTWTGRNLDNSADVTLTTYGSWSTSSSPPQDASNITSTESIEPKNSTGKVRKRITWTDNNGNYAYQFTEWYSPTSTEYREVKRWSDDLGITTGPWSTNPNPSGAPNVGNSNWFEYRDNGGKGGSWTWEERVKVTWTNPQTGASTAIYGPWVDRGGSHPDNDPPAPPGSSGSMPSHEPSYEREDPETRPVAPPDFEYVPTNGPSENRVDKESQEFVPAGYRQVRMWTGRNLDNSADVTLTTYGSWSTNSTPPSDAPDITKSEPTIETRSEDSKVRKIIIWRGEDGNKAYQVSQWHSPDPAYRYRKVKSWNHGCGNTYGSWSSNSNGGSAPGELQYLGRTVLFKVWGGWSYDDQYRSDTVNNCGIRSGRVSSPDQTPSPPPKPTSTHSVESEEVAPAETPTYIPSSDPTANSPTIGVSPDDQSSDN